MPPTRNRNPQKLNITLAHAPAKSDARDITALCVFGAHARDAELCSAKGPLLEAVRAILSAGEFKGDEDESLLLHTSTQDGAQRLLLLGMGQREGERNAHERDDTRGVRRAAAAAVRRANEAKARGVAFILPACEDPARIARAAAEGAHLGSYANDFYQSVVDGEDGSTLVEFVIISDVQDESVRARMNEEIGRGRIVGESINWARSLADEPGASLPPREFARRAAEMAAEFGLVVETLGAEEIRARGMGGLWGVGQGSDEPPALIVVRYEPEELSEEAEAARVNSDANGNASVGDELFAFVGKGITFDTGGISIKPAKNMEEMKADMAGGAAALGALRAIAQLKPRRRIVAIVPTAENMPSGKSIKPGDVVRTLAGYTIEVVDTDAEGRLVLVDGITYAKSLGATRIVDLATLTGSIIVALGDHRTGLFSNDDAWAAQVTRASERAGEPVWRMPVSDDYEKKIESDIADFKNYGGRPDATGAALLLSKFAAPTPWVHLDIAATAWLEEPTTYSPAGATGTGVRTLVELVCGSEHGAR
ncbi:MAG: leucyl aminopeptidase [Acidobacteriota bacterium]|nr:leucyl aminopeptidase [Acidobacteriota bacterium]